MNKDLLNNEEVKEIALAFANTTKAYGKTWKEFVEENTKEFKVLKLRSPDGDVCDFICYVNDDRSELLEYSLSKGYTIYSVERLKDCEIFTVGDRIEEFDTTFTIKGITKTKESLVLKLCNGNQNMRYAQKAKPLFQTVDGVDVYKGDVVYFHSKQDNATGWQLMEDILSQCFYYFSTEEALKEYIDKNKILWTTEDGVGVKKGQNVWYCTKGSGELILTTSAREKESGRHNFKDLVYFSTREAAEKYKKSLRVKPVLTTEDGVELFDKNKFDPIYCLGRLWNTYEKTLVQYTSQKLKLKVFSTEDARAKYIFENKPMWSAKEIKELYHHCVVYGKFIEKIEDVTRAKLIEEKQLIEEKLKKYYPDNKNEKN